MVKSTTKADKSTNAPKQLGPGRIRIPSAKAKATQESPPNEAAAEKVYQKGTEQDKD
jgi:hypothetical protein